MSRRSTQVTYKKLRKICTCKESNGEDYITNLPESVITNILSRLPTKVAVRTSVLSRDWEYKWTYVYNFHVKDRVRIWERFSGQKSTKSSFVNFVDRVLFLSHELTSFHLSCHEKYDSSRLNGWMSSALNCNIECFEFKANDSKGLVLPRSLLNKSSLRKLKLNASCTFNVPKENRFPNLTHLQLCNVEVQNMFSYSDPLVFTFPVLETFELKNCKWSNVNLVEIHSPRLTTIECEIDREAVINEFSIKICGARIEKFESSGGLPEKTIFYESVVVNAAFLNEPFRNYYDSDDSDEEESDLQRGVEVRKLLKEFSSVTNLQLSASMCEAVALSTQELPLPRYDKLQRLAMCLWCDTKLLFELLHSAPSLKILEIDMRADEFGGGEFDCGEVDSVPSCVISHLEEVEFVNTRDESLIRLAKFFLEKGVELKKVRLRNRSFTKDIVEPLLKIPRASACLAFVNR